MSIVFVHVPKCGGTSLLKNIEESGLTTYIDYDAYAGKGVHRRTAEASKLDYSVFDLIFGHFPIGRYKGPKYSYVNLIRDPIDRALSQFNHIRERAENGFLPPNHIGMAIANGQLDFISYLNVNAAVQKTYKLFLGHWEPSRFTLIGQITRYDAFLTEFSQLMGVTFKTDYRERVSKCVPDLSKKERSKAREILGKEYDWYDEFQRFSI